MAKNFLTLIDYPEKEIRKILDMAKDVKNGDLEGDLKGKTLAMLFEKTSTRTRVSFEVAMHQLGGHAIFLDSRTTKLAEKETLKDTVRVLERYSDAILARVYKHKDLEEIAKFAGVPIINGLSNLHHPCQTLADLLTVIERKGGIEDLKVVFIGDCAFNMARSTMIGFSKLWANVYLVCPKKAKYMPDPEFVEGVRKYVKGNIKVENDPVKGVKDADVIITDKWISPGERGDLEKRIRDLKRYQVNSELVKHAKQGFIFLHCLPASRGHEVTDEVIDSPNSMVFDAAENRLHTEKALLLYLFKGE